MALMAVAMAVAVFWFVAWTVRSDAAQRQDQDRHASSEPLVSAGPDWRRMKPLALIYNSGTGELGAEVYAIEKAHRFPNGSVEEGWYVRTVTVPGATPIWTVKPAKAKVRFIEQ
jgi:hypothetical protein